MRRRKELFAYVQPATSGEEFLTWLKDECADEFREFYAKRDQIIEKS